MTRTIDLDKTKYCLKQLRKKLGRVLKQSKAKDRLFTRGELTLLSSEARHAALEALSNVFGPQAETEQGGYWGNLLPYDKGYAHSVQFGYLSLSGRDPFKVDDPHVRAWRERDNLFYKGKRWSDPELNERFYKIFRILKSTIGDTFVPVRYWVTHAQTPHLIVTSSSKGCSASEGHLPMPWKLDDGLECCSDGEECAVRKFFERLRSLNEATVNFPGKYDEAVSELEKSPLADDFIKAHQHAVTVHNDLLEQWVQTFRKAGVCNGWDGSNRLSPEQCRDEVFRVVCLYQFHDTPYDIHLFQPCDKKHFRRYQMPNNGSPRRMKSRAWCWLAVTLPHNDSMPAEADAAASDLVNALGYLCAIEEHMTRQHAEQALYMLKFESWYHGITDKYTTLGEIVRTMLTGLCRTREHLQVQDVQCRVKSFESFVEKVAARANGRDSGISRAEARTARARARAYYDAIMSGTKDKYKEVATNIRDLVGIRLIFAFHNDIKTITKVLDTEIAKGRLVEAHGHKDTREAKITATESGIHAILNYRAVHYWVQLAGTRLEPPEAESLGGLTCEIQLKSILAHGWSNVAHDTIYKPQIPECVLATDQMVNVVRSLLHGAAYALKDQDDNLAKVRTIIDGVKTLYRLERWNDQE